MKFRRYAGVDDLTLKERMFQEELTIEDKKKLQQDAMYDAFQQGLEKSFVGAKKNLKDAQKKGLTCQN